MAELTTAKRKKLKSSQFALPGKGEGPEGKGSGSYPINDETHARAALSRVAQHGTPAEKAAVKRKVKAKYPNIEQGSGELTDLGQLTLSRFQEKFGTEAGHKKFEQAVDDGHISRPKMFRQHEGKFRQQQR